MVRRRIWTSALKVLLVLAPPRREKARKKKKIQFGREMKLQLNCMHNWVASVTLQRKGQLYWPETMSVVIALQKLWICCVAGLESRQEVSFSGQPLNFFLEKENREMFVVLKDHDLQIKWLETMKQFLNIKSTILILFFC